LVVLFPQGDVNGQTNCWESQYPGYTGTDSWSKDGVQQKAILDMIDRLKETAASGLEDLTECCSWEMPLGYFDKDGFFEETWWFGKIPQTFRNLMNY